MEAFLTSDLFRWGLLPLLIFLARTSDMTLATLRILFLSRGMRYLAALLGFFEIMIWLAALGQVMQNLTNVLNYVAYAGGFAMGNFVGSWIEEKLAVGKVIIQIVTQKDATELCHALKEKGYGVTRINAQGMAGPAYITLTVVLRKNAGEVIQLIQHYNPKAFYSLEDIRAVGEGIFPMTKSLFRWDQLHPFRFFRKGK